MCPGLRAGVWGRTGLSQKRKMQGAGWAGGVGVTFSIETENKTSTL